MTTNQWTADRRLYLDKDGKAVEADDPTRATLLVAAGGTLPLEQARSLGLLDDDGQTTEPEKARPVAPANKARKAAPENKSIE